MPSLLSPTFVARCFWAPFTRGRCENDSESLRIRLSSDILIARVCTKTIQGPGRSKMPSFGPTTKSSFVCRASTTTKRSWLHKGLTWRRCAVNTSWFDRCFQNVSKSAHHPVINSLLLSRIRENGSSLCCAYYSWSAAGVPYRHPCTWSFERQQQQPERRSTAALRFSSLVRIAMHC